ncbi:MAG: hypothetical protein NC823_00750 [Candidatus Omnitrophica bacterium]|nr:hypothetical protein [Candidatus Omnitrophota bacterium]
MIEINLLKTRASQWKLRVLVWRLFLFYVAGLFLLLFSAGVQLMADNMIIRRLEKDILRVKQQLLSEQGLMRQIQEHHSALKKAMADLNLCQKERTNRISWTNKLALVSQSLPPGMWLGTMAAREGEKGKGGKLFVMKGFVSPKVDEKKAITTFVANLSRAGEKEFSAVRLKEVKREKKQVEETVSFTVECLVTNSVRQ